MNISQIQNFNPYSSYQNPLPSFEGYKSSFSKKLDQILIKKHATKEDKEFLTNKIFIFLKKKINSKQSIGEGFHGIVYKIDDKYVLKKSIYDEIDTL